MSRMVAVPANSTAAQSRGQTQPAYVYQQQSPSVIENVLMTLLNPGVNSQTILVLNSTLGILSVVIGLMLWRFDVSGQVRLQLWIFLAVAVSLLMSVNWSEATHTNSTKQRTSVSVVAITATKAAQGMMPAADGLRWLSDRSTHHHSPFDCRRSITDGIEMMMH